MTKYKNEWNSSSCLRAGQAGLAQTTWSSGSCRGTRLPAGGRPIKVAGLRQERDACGDRGFLCKNDRGGSFRLALDDLFCSDHISMGALAAVFEAELSNLAKAGGVKISRNELKLTGRSTSATAASTVGFREAKPGLVN